MGKRCVAIQASTHGRTGGERPATEGGARAERPWKATSRTKEGSGRAALPDWPLDQMDSGGRGCRKPIPRVAVRTLIGGNADDQEAQVRRISALLGEEGPEDRETSKPRDV